MTNRDDPDLEALLEELQTVTQETQIRVELVRLKLEARELFDDDSP